MAKLTEKETAVAVANLLDGLNKSQSLKQKHNFNASQANFKRTLAGMALAETANFYKRVGAPDHVYDALQEVALALIELNDGKPSAVLKQPLAQNVTIPAEIDMFRAEAAALLYAVCDGAPVELIPAPKKQEASREIEDGLGTEWPKIARAKSSSGKPGKQFLTNLLLKFRKSEDDVTFGAMHFADQCRQISVELLTTDKAERARRIKKSIADLKARIAKHPAW